MNILRINPWLRFWKEHDRLGVENLLCNTICMFLSKPYKIHPFSKRQNNKNSTIRMFDANRETVKENHSDNGNVAKQKV